MWLYYSIFCYYYLIGTTGMVRTLSGLSLSNNPIEFPPQEVLDKGCHIVLAFLRETLKGKALGRIPPGSTFFILVNVKYIYLLFQ